MASFRVNGVEGLDLTYERKAQLSDDDLLRIIRAGAEVMRERLREKAALEKVSRALKEDLADSFKLFERKESGNPFILVSPAGKHRPNGRGIRERKSDPKRKGKTNAAVAFVLEYGSPRHNATHFMEECVEASTPEVIAAMEAEFSKLMDERGL